MAWSDGGVGLFSFLVVTLIPAAVGTDINSTDSVQDSVKWAVSEFGPCSVACGAGIQVRTVRCMRTSLRLGRSHEVKVPESLCPLPAPQLTLSCNSHVCSGSWTNGNWSECSVTCGIGTQSRQVSCQLKPWAGQGHHVAESECGGSAPESTRRCNGDDCPFSNKVETHSILSENYTLLQLHRTKKIKVNIGGQVYLLPGQTVVVKCPVKYFSKKLVYWSKGYRLVPFMGRVRATSGGLHINRGDPKTDSGIYTCIAGDVTAIITVTFIGKNDPSTKMYKKWIQKSNKRNKKYSGKYKNRIPENNNIIMVTPTDIVSEELNQQRDQSHNFSQSLIFVASDWSTCSAPCGVRGLRKRNVTCSYVTPKYVKIVSDNECHRAGLDKPETTEECPMDEKCAVWYTGPWSQCLPECGLARLSSRLLTCVWESTDKPAGAACDSRNKPAAFKPCRPRTCPLECYDSSRFCSLSSLLKLCSIHYFQQECCLTCQSLSNFRS